MGDTDAVDELLIDRKAPARRIQLDATSWVDLVEGFVRDAPAAFTDLHDTTPWQQSEVLRYDRYVPEKRLSAGRRPDTHPLLRQIDLHLNATYRKPFDGAHDARGHILEWRPRVHARNRGRGHSLCVRRLCCATRATDMAQH